MANRHFGNIGDIWKHLPLAEILRIESPLRYWESHSGSARYVLTHSPGRDFGIYYFLDHAQKSQSLVNSAYVRLLSASTGLGTGRGYPGMYPGSPSIAMALLEGNASFLFCDIDAESINDIRSRATELGLSSQTVSVKHTDGIPALASALSHLSNREALSTLTFIDPYRPLDRSANGLNSVQLMFLLGSVGVKTVLWYGYCSREERTALLDGVGQYLSECDSPRLQIWRGDVSLKAINDPKFNENTGVLGCGIVCANLSRQSITECRRLGKALVGVYEAATFPSGHNGALRYTDVTF
jgi:23S rRNA A2030 N6-methylase RlmJ